MPKKTKHPRLRSHSRKNKAGKVWTGYYFDMRPEGKPDIALGTDYDAALKKWEELFYRRPMVKGTLKEAFDEWEERELPKYENAGTRRTYAQNLKTLRPVFGPARWHNVKLPNLVDYLDKRSAPIQANREMALLSIIWHYAQKRGFTELPYPAAGLKRSKWKNKERAREFDVSDAVFEAVYACAEPMLRDCMDLASATGLRLTDCRRLSLPTSGVLSLRSSKTGKSINFEVAASPILTELVSRRRIVGALHVMLLTMPTGKPVTEANLRGAWDRAREKAAEKAEAEKPELAGTIRRMFLRDMRKRAAALAGSLDEASELLQHSSKRVTLAHYRQVNKVKPVR